MASSAVIIKVTNLFLDRQHVIDAIGKAKVRVLKRSGGKIRTIAQRSMRYRNTGYSKPGVPPFAHKKHGARLRKLLFFAYDDSSGSVVVGPVALGKAIVPSLQEFGGRQMVRRLSKPIGSRKATPAQALAFRLKVQSGQITPVGRPKILYLASYLPRPYMEPALEKASPSLPREWTNSVVGP